MVNVKRCFALLIFVKLCLLGVNLIGIYWKNIGDNFSYKMTTEETHTGKGNPFFMQHFDLQTSTRITLRPLADIASHYEREIDLSEYLEAKQKNLSSISLNNPKNKDWVYKNYKKGNLPYISDTNFPNTYWQELDLSPGKFYLYTSYLDNRRGNIDGPSIRILGLRNSSLNPQINLKCLIWFDEEANPTVSKVIEQQMFSKYYIEKGKLQPYLLSCPLPKPGMYKVPSSVSLVKLTREKSTNKLNVIYNKVEKKKEFAVCVKCLYNIRDDFVVRLVEWLELMSLLGADKVFFYYKVEKTDNLKFLNLVNQYVEKGLVDFSYYSSPNAPLGLSGKIKRNKPIEMITRNDCLYRNLYRYKYVVVLDPDEVIVPRYKSNWRDLLQSVEKQISDHKQRPVSTFIFRNVYFMDDMLDSYLKSRNTNSEDIILNSTIQQLPNHMHMLRHVIRSNILDTSHMKSIHKTDHVVIVHSHYAIKCFEGCCNSEIVDPNTALLHHYRNDCQGGKNPEKYYKGDITKVNKVIPPCQGGKNLETHAHKVIIPCYKMKNSTIKDSVIWQYKEQLMNRVSKSMLSLGIKEQNKVLFNNTTFVI